MRCPGRNDSYRRRTISSLLAVGGCRSGKSRVALDWALRFSGPYAFVPAADPGNDPEMQARVARHQAERGSAWQIVQNCADPCLALQDAARTCKVAVFDCVTVWLSNLMLLHDDEQTLVAVRSLAALLREPPLPVAVVSNETGEGIVPSFAAGRRFRDLQGEANQLLASACSTVVFVHCGLPLVLKGDF